MPKEIYYSDDDWSVDSPSLQDELLYELFDEFDPAARFGPDSPDQFSPWQAPSLPYTADAALEAALNSPQSGFDIQESGQVQADGPGGASFFDHPHEPGVAPGPFVAPPMVLPMLQGTDGVYRDVPVSYPYYEHAAQPERQATIELSPYMALPVASSFSIKGDECGCHDCQCGES